MRWHCYIEHYESVVHATVDAGCADDAAVLAAEETSADGLWTVVAIDPERGVSRIKVQQTRSYEAVSAESGPS